jgi:hypothetical protein
MTPSNLILLLLTLVAVAILIKPFIKKEEI